MVVEDEPIAQLGLLEYIEQLDFLDLIAITDNLLDASEIIEKENIQLQFINADVPKIHLNTQKDALEKINTIVISGHHHSTIITKNNKLQFLHKPVSFLTFHKACLEEFEKITLNPEHLKFYKNCISSRN